MPYPLAHGFWPIGVWIVRCLAAKRPAPVLDLSALSAEQGLVIQGDAAGDTAGRSVSAAGDVNGDGLSDVIVGAPFAGGGSGEAYVVFGSDQPGGSGESRIDVTTLAPAEGVVLAGTGDGDQFGVRATSAGDVDGDGWDDLIVGAPLADGGGVNAGEAYVVFGGNGLGSPDSSGRTVIDVGVLSADDGFVIRGAAAGDQAGANVSAAGDVNGDGFDDIVVGARQAGAAGAAYVLFGTDAGIGAADPSGRRVVDLGTLSPDQGFIVRGDAAGDEFGRTVSAAGDVNGDGYDDVIIGAYRGDDGGEAAGEAYVVFGGPSGFGEVEDGGRAVVDLGSLSEEEGFVIRGDSAGDETGAVVSGAGDVNGDGFDDLIVGARHGDDGGTDAGEAYVVFGTDDGFGTADADSRNVVDLSCLSPSEGLVLVGDSPGDSAGWSVSAAGDVNGDGFDDLIVGARFGDDGGIDAGEAYVIFGSRWGFGSPDASGRQVIDLGDLRAADGFVIAGAPGDEAGRSVSDAGDVNGDGFDDLLVGAPHGDDGGSNAGEAYVIFGSARIIRDISLAELATADGFEHLPAAASDFLLV